MAKIASTCLGKDRSYVICFQVFKSRACNNSITFFFNGCVLLTEEKPKPHRGILQRSARLRMITKILKQSIYKKDLSQSFKYSKGEVKNVLIPAIYLFTKPMSE